MSVKEAYQNCYRLVRLQQQCLTLLDFDSEDEVFSEFTQYPYWVHRAALLSWESLWALPQWHEWVRRTKTKSVWFCPLCGNRIVDDGGDLPPLPQPEGVF